MQDMEMKKKVAQEIMALMDEKDGERLKSHPKLMAAKIEVEKPESELELEAKPEGMESEEELSPEMVQKLLEMMSGK